MPTIGDGGVWKDVDELPDHLDEKPIQPEAGTPLSPLDFDKSQDIGPSFHRTSHEILSPSPGPIELQPVKTKEDSPHPPASLVSSIQSQITAPQSSLREIAFIATLCTAQLFTQAALAIALQPLHIIGASFSTTNPGQLSWFLAAYSMTVGTFILPAGRLGDLYGHKKFFVLGSVWFGVWSVIAGLSVFSGARVFFDFCRAMQGIGPAFMLPNAVAILGMSVLGGLEVVKY